MVTTENAGDGYSLSTWSHAVAVVKDDSSELTSWRRSAYSTSIHRERVNRGRVSRGHESRGQHHTQSTTLVVPLCSLLWSHTLRRFVTGPLH